MQVKMVICIQQLCILQINKCGKSVRYFKAKDQVEKRSIKLHIQDTMNLNPVGYLKVNFTLPWKF